jgi:hypothetical protein
LQSTIVAANTAAFAPDVPQRGVDGGSANNLIGDGTGSGLSDGVDGNQVGGNGLPFLDPLLAPLANYGGPTQTMALLPGSPAIGRGAPAGPGVPTTDQRGLPRPTSGQIDVGAFQTQITAVAVSPATATYSAAPQNVTLVATVTDNGSPMPLAQGAVAFTVVIPGGTNLTATAPIDVHGAASAAVTLPAGLASGSYTIAASYRDSAAIFRPSSGSNMLTVQRQPPTVTVNGPSADPEGTAVTFTGSVTGGDTLAAPYSFTWHVTAGNGQSIADQTGTVSAPGAVPSFTFTPADEGAYTVTLTVTDQFNLTGAQSAALTATNVAPTATITGLSQPNSLFILAGDALTFSGAFSDPGTLDGHSVTWHFGDGSSTTRSFGPGGSASFIGNHAFAAPGTYLVTLTVTDDDGGVGTAQMTVIVQTPAGATGSLLSYVQSLAQLNSGQQNALVSTLNAVSDSLNRGNTTAAKNQLGAFENKVKALFQAGLLTQAQEDTLLGSADAIEQAIG